MKVIIAGSRDDVRYTDVVEAYEKAGFIATEIVSGTARGADTLGETFARLKGIPVHRMPANWTGLGKKAGLMRNEDMGRYADAAVVVWNGRSRGTKHMIDFMKKLGKPCFVLEIDPCPF